MHDPERGSSTVLGAAIVAIVFMLLVAGLTLGGVVLATHRARAAADLGALAGAARLAGTAPGTEEPCAVADRVVADNGARLVRCAVEGADVVVETAVATPALLGTLPEAAGHARAGPPRPAPGGAVTREGTVSAVRAAAALRHPPVAGGPGARR